MSTLPYGKLIGLVVLIGAIIYLLSANGMHLKLGSKEVYINGTLKRLSLRDGDIQIREYLKSRTDEIDKDIINNIEDVVDNICYHVNDYFPELNEHCYFTVEKFTSIIRQELYKRVRRNNLKIRLTEQSKAKYIAKIVNAVSEKYLSLQAIAKECKCGSELYPPFDKVEGYVIKYVELFFNEARKAEINGIKEKINLYSEYAGKFKTKELKETSIDKPMAKNIKYLENLEKIN